MPDIIVNFVPDFSKVETATDQLVSSGQISKPFVEELKKVQGSVDQTATATTSSLGKLSANTKGIARQMAEGMKDGLKDGLKDAADKLDKDLKRIKDSFKQVSGSKELTALNAQLKVFKTALASEKRPAAIDAYTKAIGELTLEVQTLEDAENNSAGATKSLKLQLRELTAAIAQATLEGKNSGPEFQEMVERAGEIKDAMGDAAAQINTFASDTAKLDEVIAIATGVAAAFSVVQGATALLGDESEELQETFVKLQAVQSILTGLQTIQNLKEEQSAAIKGIVRLQTLAQTAATNLETAATSKNIIIKTLATFAMSALNKVMAANPVFLLIGAFAVLGGLLAAFTSKTETAEEAAKRLNDQFQRELDYLDAVDKALNSGRDKLIKQLESEISVMQARGDATNDIMKKERDLAKLRADNANQSAGLHGIEMDQIDEAQIQLENFNARLKVLNDEKRTNSENWVTRTLFGARGQKEIENDIKKTEGAITDLQAILDVGTQKRDAAIAANTELLAKQAEIQKKIREDALKSDVAAAEARVLQSRIGSAQELNARISVLQAQRRQELANVNLTAGERLKIEANTLKAIRDLRFDYEKRQLEDNKAFIEASLESQLEGSEAEFKARGAFIRAQMEVDLKSQQLTEGQRLAIIAKAEKALVQLDRDRITKLLEDEKTALDAQLANMKLNAQERERITTNQLNKQRQVELSQVINNQEKIKEINARFDKEIAEQRLAIRQQAFEQEQALETAQGATRKRHIESLADDENANVIARILAIRQVEQIDTESVQRRMASNEQLFRDGLITETAYKIELARLKDEEAQIHENAEKKRTGVTESETEKRKNKLKEELLAVLSATEQIIGSINSIAQAFSERTLANIEGQKKALDQLKEAGALTEKEFTKRQKKLEAEENAAKLRAAKRDKAVALFSAVIQGAKAIVEAAPNPVMIALTAALVAAQIAVIAAKPLPKFGKGTKRAPKGFAQIGETGAELVQDEKGYYLAQHPQIVYLKGGEKIYNPKETIQILQQETPMAKADLTSSKGSNNSPAIDYKKLTKMFGDEISKHPRNVINMDEQGFTRHVIEAQSKTRYLNKRHTFNG